MKRLVPLAALAAVMLAPSSALAADGPLAGGGSFARTAPFVDGWLYAFECHAAAPGAVATTVSSCTLDSIDGAVAAPPATAQGAAAATDGAVSTNPSLVYDVCWTVGARYGDGTTQTSSGCSAASSLAGAG
jgi:hypothetical protein